MAERLTFSLGFFYSVGEAAAREHGVPLVRNPFPLGTEDHERWWAELIEVPFSDLPPRPKDSGA